MTTGTKTLTAKTAEQIRHEKAERTGQITRRDVALECRVLDKELVTKRVAEGKMRPVRDPERVMRFVASTERVDRMGDIVRQAIEFKAFQQNPVILWDHDQGKPLGKSVWEEIISDKDDPDVKRIGPHTVIYVEFATKAHGEHIEPAFLLYKDGYLKGGSVGFTPQVVDEVLDEEQRKTLGLGPAGVVYEKSELAEFSLCTVPANPDALVTALKHLAPRERIAARRALMTRKSEATARRPRTLADVVAGVAKIAASWRGAKTLEAIGAASLETLVDGLEAVVRRGIPDGQERIAVQAANWLERLHEITRDYGEGVPEEAVDSSDEEEAAELAEFGRVAALLAAASAAQDIEAMRSKVDEALACVGRLISLEGVTGEEIGTPDPAMEEAHAAADGARPPLDKFADRAAGRNLRLARSRLLSIKLEAGALAQRLASGARREKTRGTTARKIYGTLLRPRSQAPSGPSTVRRDVKARLPAGRHHGRDDRGGRPSAQGAERR